MAYRKLILQGQASQPIQNNFDALRLAMALFVIWSHSFAIHLGSEQGEWLSVLLHGVFNAGNIGVMAFFVISGFLISQSYERSRSRSAYFRKRIRRIYPGYIVATAISGCFFLHFLAPKADVGSLAWMKMFGMNLLLRNYSPAADPAGVSDGGLLSINGALWSIPYEFWCYIGLAIFGSIVSRPFRLLLVLSLVSVMTAHVILDMLGKKPGLGVIGIIVGWPYLWTKMAPCFMLGMVAYVYRANLPRSLPLLLLLFSASIIACWSNSNFGFLITLPSLAYAIFYAAFSERVRLHGAAKYGDFSYGTYLYGFLIQKTLQFTVARGWGVAEFFLVSAALSILAGVISWHVVERRFMPRRTTSRSGATEEGDGALESRVSPAS